VTNLQPLTDSLLLASSKLRLISVDCLVDERELFSVILFIRLVHNDRAHIVNN